MSFKVKGLNAVKVGILKQGKRVTEATQQALVMEAHAIMNESQVIVPRDTGWLAASNKVLPKKISGGVAVTLEYRADYAWFVHEINKNYTVGRWKFLEEPMKRAVSGFAKRVADRAKLLSKG